MRRERNLPAPGGRRRGLTSIPENGVETVADALQGAKDILSPSAFSRDRLNTGPYARRCAAFSCGRGSLRSREAKDTKDHPSTALYYDF